MIQIRARVFGKSDLRNGGACALLHGNTGYQLDRESSSYHHPWLESRLRLTSQLVISAPLIYIFMYININLLIVPLSVSVRPD